MFLIFFWLFVTFGRALFGIGRPTYIVGILHLNFDIIQYYYIYYYLYMYTVVLLSVLLYCTMILYCTTVLRYCCILHTAVVLLCCNIQSSSLLENIFFRYIFPLSGKKTIFCRPYGTLRRV